MKRVDLPITRTFATPVINIKEELASGKKIIPLGTIDASKGGVELNQARINGGNILWSAICLEQKLESIITEFLFPKSTGAHEQKGCVFFSERIIKDDHLSYSVKKRLVIDIVNDESLLKGKDKEDLDQVIKKVMDYRNAFAHGGIIYVADRGCVLSYWKGGLKEDTLNDQYWTIIEGCFRRAHALVDEIMGKLGGL